MRNGRLLIVADAVSDENERFSNRSWSSPAVRCQLQSRRASCAFLKDATTREEKYEGINYEPK
jgi:hypothetical protein